MRYTKNGFTYVYDDEWCWLTKDHDLRRCEDQKLAEEGWLKQELRARLEVELLARVHAYLEDPDVEELFDGCVVDWFSWEDIKGMARNLTIRVEVVDEKV